MDRRAFLGSMLKVAAATALPSEIWPFRKIFLPAQSPILGITLEQMQTFPLIDPSFPYELFYGVRVLFHRARPTERFPLHYLNRPRPTTQYEPIPEKLKEHV
jgi:hypothetical protein